MSVEHTREVPPARTSVFHSLSANADPTVPLPHSFRRSKVTCCLLQAGSPVGVLLVLPDYNAQYFNGHPHLFAQ